MTEVVSPPVRPPRPHPAPAAFGGITAPTGREREATGPDFTAIHRGQEFTALRRRVRRVVFPVSALFFVWYLTYVLLAAYARDFMAIRLVGSITVGLVLGLAQFASTIGITAWYSRWARRTIDPAVDRIRAEVNGR